MDGENGTMIEIKVTHVLDEFQFKTLVEMMGGAKVSPPLEAKPKQTFKEARERSEREAAAKWYKHHADPFRNVRQVGQALHWCDVCGGACRCGGRKSRL